MTRLAVVAAVTALSAGCTGSPAAEREPPAPQRYVALGDSYTAGPLVPTTDLAGGCLRSDGNYPSILAAREGLTLVDVSCSGATTADLADPQATVRDSTVPPQLDALDAGADLVTLGIGGNDLRLFSSLVRTCLNLRAKDPTGSPCSGSAVGSRMLDALDTIGANVEKALDRVRRRAPDARVVLVGYPRIAPSSGSCQRRLPFAAGDVAFGDRVMRGLADELRTAASAAGVEYLDMYAASRGHDVCSAKPWVNGATSRPGFAAAYHPTPAGMRAVAGRLAALLAP